MSGAKSSGGGGGGGGEDPHVLTQAIEYPVLTLCINIGSRVYNVLTREYQW